MARIPPFPSSASRRAVLGGMIAAAALPAAAQTTGFAVDWQGASEDPAVLRSLAAQVALVRALRIKPDIAAFFADQPIAIDPAGADTHTRAGPRGIFFERRPVPADNPVLLHELLHRYHLLRRPGGFADPVVARFYRAAKTGGTFPQNSYMLTNVQEFFAMTASVVLHGRAARPPFVRANVAARAPDLYGWLVAEFGVTV